MKMPNASTSSYVSADALPIKLLQSPSVVKSIAVKGIIPPYHVQFIPTNRCNLSCGFCSCSEEDRKLELDNERILGIIRMLEGLGTKAVTITGGGDPLLHPSINNIIGEFNNSEIAVGLVTNGLLLKNKLKDRRLYWCRISHGDERKFDINYAEELNEVVEWAKNVDWAFSYVISDKPEVPTILSVLSFAERHRFTHVRLVADLLNPENSPIEDLRRELKDYVDKLSIPVIFQGRDKPRHGGDCYICYLKPLIGADGKVYTCCGAQYALDPPSKSLPKELCLGDVEDLPDIINKSGWPFDGSICKRCYYTDYNDVLKAMLTHIEHEDFV